MLINRTLFDLVRRFAGKTPALILIASLLAGPLVTSQAQTFRGTILGTVSDTSGAIIPEAAVTAKNVTTGLERSTKTDSSGNYSIPELPIGTYEVRVEMRGFQAARVSDVVVAVAGERRVDVALSPSGGGNVVTV